MTNGAPERCVTLCSAIASYIGLARTRAQADMRAGEQADRPREAPAVAVEHRQRPEIDRVLAHAGGDRVGVAHQRRAAMVVDDALRIAGGAAGVIERDGVPFVGRHRPGKCRVAIGDKRLVVESAETLSLDAAFEVAVIDQQRLHLGMLQRLLEHAARTRYRRSAPWSSAWSSMKAIGRRVEPRIDGVQHGAGHRHAVMRLEHGGRVGEHHRDGVADADVRARRAPRRAGGCARRTRRRRAAIRPWMMAAWSGCTLAARSRNTSGVKRLVIRRVSCRGRSHKDWPSLGVSPGQRFLSRTLAKARADRQSRIRATSSRKRIVPPSL